MDTWFVGRHVARNEHCHQGALTDSVGSSNVGCVLAGKSSRVQCDNMAVVHIIAANSSKDATVMHLLRGLHFVSAYYNINLRAVHIPGSINICVDAISRNLLLQRKPPSKKVPHTDSRLLVERPCDQRVGEDR